MMGYFVTRLLGRFFQRCIQVAKDHQAGIRVNLYDPDYMTDEEISHFIHGRGPAIDWDLIESRRKSGDKQAPWPVSRPFGRAVT